MLKPLQQFICDKCGEIIESPKEGWIEWESKIDGVPVKQSAWGFKIVHHYAYSPNKKDDGSGSGCSFYEDSGYRSDAHLDHWMGDHTMPELLSFLDIGPYHESEYKGPSIVYMREFVEIMRRLTIPYYEEARLYWDKATSDGYFGDINELAIYLPDRLEALIKHYR